MGCKNCKNSGFRKLNETKKNALKKALAWFKVMPQP